MDEQPMAPTMKTNGGEKPSHTAHGEAQRAALVHAAYDLIAEKGLEGLRTRDVAKKAGVNVATLHYYFATKEDLIRGVVDLLREQLAYTGSPLAQIGSRGPLEELRRELADMQYQLQVIPKAFAVLFELHLRSLRDPAIGDIMQGMDVSWRHHIEEYLTAGVQQGIFRADLDIAAAAAALMAVVKGAMLQLIFNPQAFPASRVSAEIERWLSAHASTQPAHKTHHGTHD